MAAAVLQKANVDRCHSCYLSSTGYLAKKLLNMIIRMLKEGEIRGCASFDMEAVL